MTTTDTPALISALSRFDCVLAVDHIDDFHCIDVQFNGQSYLVPSADLETIARECREAGLTLLDSWSTDLGLRQRYRLPDPEARPAMLPVLTPDEIDHWSALMAEEVIVEGRIHRRSPVNPHD